MKHISLASCWITRIDPEMTKLIERLLQPADEKGKPVSLLKHEALQVDIDIEEDPLADDNKLHLYIPPGALAAPDAEFGVNRQFCASVLLNTLSVDERKTVERFTQGLARQEKALFDLRDLAEDTGIPMQIVSFGCATTMLSVNRTAWFPKDGSALEWDYLYEDSEKAEEFPVSVSIMPDYTISFYGDDCCYLSIKAKSAEDAVWLLDTISKAWSIETDEETGKRMFIEAITGREVSL